MSATQTASTESAKPAPGPDVVLRALADPHRRQMLKLVANRELAAGQIAEHFEITQQGVSQHLRVLEKAGLLSERREGTRRLYALEPASLEPVSEVLAELWPDALMRLKHVVETKKREEKKQQ